MPDLNQSIDIISFSNRSKEDYKRLKAFVSFHRDHYKDDPMYVPLFDCEYLGSKLIGIVGFFEPSNLFFKHAEMQFFLALQNQHIAGRCLAFVNHDHNSHWKDKTGFFGHFECIDNESVANALLNAARTWLKNKGMNTMRGPQNLPVNEATPGIMTEGFHSRPVIYYNYNKPYYEKLLLACGLKPIKKIFSWEVPVMNPMEPRLQRVAQKVIERYNITVESWDQRPFHVRVNEMLDIYNDAWHDNFGFIPFRKEEFNYIMDGLRLIMDKGLFLFLYVNGEPAAFLGGVPNIAEKMVPKGLTERFDLLRMIKMFLSKGSIKGFRLGYLGVKKKFHHLGLDGVMIWKQKIYTQEKGLEYSDLGWVLENNTKTISLIEMMGATPSKTYTIFQENLEEYLPVAGGSVT